MVAKATDAGLSARVAVRTRGVRDGEVHPTVLEPGTIIHGSLAAEAIRAGWAKLIKAPMETAVAAPAETKAEAPKENPIQPGAGKSSASAPAGRAPRKRTSTSSKAKRGSS